MEKIYLVELNIFKENAFYGLQKIPLDNIFPWNFYIWSAIVNGACMQNIKIGHWANFQARNKYFVQILFPVWRRSRPLLLRISGAHAIHDVARAASCISSARTESKLNKI